MPGAREAIQVLILMQNGPRSLRPNMQAKGVLPFFLPSRELVVQGQPPSPVPAGSLLIFLVFGGERSEHLRHGFFHVDTGRSIPEGLRFQYGDEQSFPGVLRDDP